MFDLVSTTEGADPQSVRCARLLAAVIAQAIEDASAKITHEEAELHRAFGEPSKALNWLFDKHSTFSLYATLIGANPVTIREALLSNQKIVYSAIKKKRGEKDADPQSKRYTEFDRRNLQARHRWTYGG